MINLARLRHFVSDFTALIDAEPDEQRVIDVGSELLRGLVAQDDWLPQSFATPDPERYQQYLLHCDPHQRFSVVSFVWGPGQKTPVHEHRTWGLIGMLRGSEYSQPYVLQDGKPVAAGEPHCLVPGAVEVVSPSIGDIHRVSNAFNDRSSISIHVYGANISAVNRLRYSSNGEPFFFMSAYSNALTPNLWDLAENAH